MSERIRVHHVVVLVIGALSMLGAQPRAEQPRRAVAARQYVSETPQELWDLFRPGSSLTSLQKKVLWKSKFKGNWVRWSGDVGEVRKTLWIYSVTFDYGGGATVLVTFPAKWKAVLLRLVRGENFRYEAKLGGYHETLGGFNLSDGEPVK